MRLLEIKELEKSYNQRQVVNKVSLNVRRGEVVGLLGPNGAGKTTSFYMIVGVVFPDRGQILFDNQNITYLPIHRRARYGIGYLSQDPSVFRKLSVEENIMAVLETCSLSAKQRRRRLDELLEELNIGHLRRNKAYTLSGGEMRRLEITRSLVTNPSFLLLDEPFANLDRNLKMETAQFIRSTCRHFGTTIISVTHDLEEAFAMSDRVGILLDGRLEQYDTARTVYFSPASWAAARFLGPVNMIPRSVHPLLEWPDGKPGDELVFSRGEGLELIPDPGGVWEIEEIRFVGVLILYTIYNGHNGGTRLKVYCVGEGLDQGDRVRCRVGRYFTDSREVERRAREWKDGV